MPSELNVYEMETEAEMELCRCALCGDNVPESEGRELRGYITRAYPQVVFVCDDCRVDGLEVCCQCDDYVAVGLRHYSERTESYYCDGCYNDTHMSCDDCNNDFLRDELREINGCDYCADCASSHSGGTIHGYSYKPVPVFYGERGDEYYGLELEIDKGNDTHRAAAKVGETLGGVAYCKDDSSLADGVEIVTHPMTYEHFMSAVYPQLGGLFADLRRGGFRSHDTDTCGFHVHVSRLAFGADRNAQQHGVARFLWMWERFYPEVLRLSRRTVDRMERWAARYGLEPHERTEDLYFKAAGDSCRYHMVNLENTHTVEVRCFRGTLKSETLAASVQLVKLFVRLATSNIDVYRLTWGGVAKRAKALGYSELDAYIIDRFRDFDTSHDEAYVGTKNGDL